MTDRLYDFAGLSASLDEALVAVLGESEAAAGGAAVTAAPPAAAELTLPPRRDQGDITTNAALVNARRAGCAPRDLAQRLGEAWLGAGGAAVCARLEVAGPGFLNIFLAPSWFRGAVQRMLDAGRDYGRGVLPPERRLRVNVEYVSANPVGPLHVGNARYGAMGDALCRVFEFAGHEVGREYYVNDAGTQMVLFGQTLAARYAQQLGIPADIPENGYQGAYVVDLAAELLAERGERYREAVAAAAPDMARLPTEVVTELKLWGRDRMLAQFRETLGRLRIRHDIWTNESSVYEGPGEHRGFHGEVAKALAELDAEGLLYEKDGAVWLRTTNYGDDKDRVVIRSSGEPTYFLSDIAYHRDKMDRGFEHMIDIWGADHHGYVPRMKAAFTALPPHDPDRLELIIGQFVNLLEGGEQKRMSKRRGTIVTVDDLVDAIGVDATRFTMVSRSHDTPLDIDLELVVRQSSQNPVYYVQYAHARICSILRNLEQRTGKKPPRVVPELALEDDEKALVLKLAGFPFVVLAAADHRAPHRVHTYLGELAAQFHVFYRNCRVLVDDDDVAGFRAGLCAATRQTLARGLDLLGVSAPESM
ncbi:MAG TPA: arginine--tRNA ligase [Thermoleophilia bacterium]|nr:arginine--tRNA ligase [Thermoleophilia bacterium]HQG54143.1 arginine--tRNA ligase [Thermoleophilia bacterium]